MRKHAFVTVAAKSIGRAMVLSLVHAGYDITIHCHQSVQEARALGEEIAAIGQKACVVRADLGQLDSLAACMEESVNALGAPTLLVHNASIFEKEGLEDATPASLERHMRVNALAPIMLSKAFMAHLPQDQKGHIVCLLDGMQGWSISPHFLSYSLSKLALEQFITLQAPVLAPHIRLNGIRLGATLEGAMDKPETFDKVRAMTPMRATSSPEEVCNALHALEALPNVTGQVIDVSGGMSLLHAHKNFP